MWKEVIVAIHLKFIICNEFFNLSFLFVFVMNFPLKETKDSLKDIW